MLLGLKQGEMKMLTPVAFIDNAELSFRDVNKVDIHVFWAEKEHVLIFANLHWSNILSGKRT